MAEDSFQEKTEEATPKRLAEAREEGNVPKSAEMNSAFILLFGLMTLGFMGSQLMSTLESTFRIFYQEAGHMSLDMDSLEHLLSHGILWFVGLLAPFVTAIATVALVINVAQVGFMFAGKKLQPKFSQINPIAGMKKFVSPKALVELVKGIFKLAIVGSIAYYTLRATENEYLKLVYADVSHIMSFVSSTMFLLGIRISVALVVLAILDFYYQRWQYKHDMRMSKTDVKEEQKQSEGDPQVKSAIRSLQQQRARQRMVQKVADADVVITNPTHLAVALKYDPEAMVAPIVLAKGARLMAKRIREEAAQHGVPILENKPLARSLYKLCDVGREVPIELFHAVAEVFAYIYQLRNRKN